MRLKDVIKAEKSALKIEPWKAGPMPKSLYPLTKSGSRALRFRAGYEWQLVSFTALGSEFKLLVAVNFAKEQYYAHLGMVCGGDTRMLGSYEFHGTHPGWHFHGGCGAVELIPVGRYEGPWRKMLPASHINCRRKTFGVTEANRTVVALEAFNVFGGSEPNGQLRWT